MKDVDDSTANDVGVVKTAETGTVANVSIKLCASITN